MQNCTALLALGLLALPVFGIDKLDVEYSRPDGKPLLLDIHVPEGKGPFPAAIAAGKSCRHPTRKNRVFVGVLLVIVAVRFA